MTIIDRQTQLIARFSKLTQWEERYKAIILAGKALPVFPEEHRLDKFKVQGCQSQVWLYPEFREVRVIFHADSDALITKGLIALLLEIYSGASPKEILQTPPDFIREIGLETKLSASRANGLFSMVKQIKLYATVFAMQQ